MAGRNPKPIHLHVVDGTFRPDRHSKEVPPTSAGLPVAPAHLSKRAVEIFGTIVGRMKGWASETHTEIIALCAMAHEEVELCNNLLINTDGTPCFSYLTSNSFGDKILKARPEVAQRRTAQKLAQTTLSDLGLTPASMGKVPAPKVGKKNEFLDF